MTNRALSTVRPALARYLSSLSLAFLSLLLATAEVRAGADFIGGQANAVVEQAPDPEAVEGDFDDRAQAMQQWLQNREDERRQLGVAHVYERPKAIEDNYARPHFPHASWGSHGGGSKHGSARSRKSSAGASHSTRSGAKSRRPSTAGGKAKASAKPTAGTAKASGKSTAGKSGASGKTAKSSGSGAKKSGSSAKRRH